MFSDLTIDISLSFSLPFQFVASPLKPEQHKRQRSTKGKEVEEEEDMKQLCITDTSVLALFMDDIFSICSFLASNPLHLAYVLFFSPYVLSFLAFFFPLLFSTLLLLLVLISISPYVGHVFHESPPKFLGKTCCIALDAICTKPEPDGINTIGVLERLQSIVLLLPEHEYEGVPILERLKEMGEFYSVCSSLSSEEEEESLVKLALENNHDQEKSSSHEDTDQEFKEVEPLEFEESIEKFNHQMEAVHDNAEEDSPKRMSTGRRMHSRGTSESLQSEESMKKQEKEWKRTLACKLYEERMTLKLCEDPAAVEGISENMDMLWEAYEVNGSKDHDSDRVDEEVKGKEKEVEAEEEEEEEDQEDEGSVRKLCCLQALKFSTRKKTFGVGKPNLMKISKLLKRMTTFSSIGTKKSRQ